MLPCAFCRGWKHERSWHLLSATAKPVSREGLETDPGISSRGRSPQWTTRGAFHALHPGSCLHLGTAARPAEWEVLSTCPPFLVSDPVKAAYGERCIDHGHISPLHATQLGLRKGSLLGSAEGPSPLWVCEVQRLSVKPPSPARWPSCSELEALARQPRGQLTLQLSLWLSTRHLPLQTLKSFR